MLPFRQSPPTNATFLSRKDLLEIPNHSHEQNGEFFRINLLQKYSLMSTLPVFTTVGVQLVEVFAVSQRFGEPHGGESPVHSLLHLTDFTLIFTPHFHFSRYRHDCLSPKLHFCALSTDFKRPFPIILHNVTKIRDVSGARSIITVSYKDSLAILENLVEEKCGF